MSKVKELIKELTPFEMVEIIGNYFATINRVEVIDQNGRSYVNWKPKNTIKLQIQDGGKTLKIFVS